MPLLGTAHPDSSPDDHEGQGQSRYRDPPVLDTEKEQESEWWLDCETDQPRPLVQLLTLLLHTPGKSAAKDPTMTLFCGRTGLTIHNAPNPQFQSTLELPMSLYRTYHVATGDSDGDGEGENFSSFSVSSKALLECLQVLCIENPQQLLLKYHGLSQVLRLEARLSRGGIASAAILGKIPPTESAELSAAFGACEVVARLLCASIHLQDTSELELVAGATSISVQFDTMSEPSLTLSVVGHSSQCEVILPGPVEITGGNKIVKHHYPIEAWKRAIKAIELAKETCLSINANGILAIQHQIILTGQQEAAFCDSLLLPLVLPEDEDPSTATPSTTATGGTTLISRSDRVTEDVSLSSRYSHPLHSEPLARSTRPLDDTSTIATERHAPDDNSDTDDASTDLPAISHPPLTFGSNKASSTTSDAGSRKRPSHRRRLMSHQQRRSSASSTSPSSPGESNGVDSKSESIPTTPPRQRKRSNGESLLSQDSSSSSSSSPSPPSPVRQPEYCSSPEVVYGDMP